MSTILVHHSGSTAQEVEAVRFDYLCQGEAFAMAWHADVDNPQQFTVTHVASGMKAATFTVEDATRHGLDFVAAATDALNRRTTPARMRSVLAAAPARYF